MNTTTPSATRFTRTAALGALVAVACSGGCNLTGADFERFVPTLSGGTAEYISREAGLGNGSILVRTAVEIGAIAITSQIRANEKQKAEAAEKAKVAYDSAPPEIKKEIDAGERKIAVRTSDGKVAVTDRNGAMVPDSKTNTQDVYEVKPEDQTKLAQAKGNGKLNDMNVWYSDN